MNVDCQGNCQECLDTCCCAECFEDTCATKVDFECLGCLCEEVGIECATDTCEGKPGFVYEGCCCEEGVDCLIDTCANKPDFDCQGCYCQEGVTCLTDTCNRTFEKLIGGTSHDSGWSVADAADGGYIVTGSYTNPVTSDVNIYLVKLDSMGNLKWSKNAQYGDADYEYGVDVRELSNKDILILGNKNKGGNNWQLYLIRTDLTGVPIWSKDFGLNKLDLGFSMIQKSVGSGFLMCGYTGTYVETVPSRGIESIIFEASTEGIAGTRSNIGESGNDYGSCIELAHDGNYLLLTTIAKVPATGSKLMLYKLDQQYATLWKKEVITSCIPNHRGCIRRMPGQDGYLVAGVPVGGDIRLIHVDNNGDGGLNSDNYYSILNAEVQKSVSAIILNDGNYLVVSDNMTLVKVRHDLTNQIWRKEFTDASTSGVHALLEAKDGGLVIVGTKRKSATDTDILVIKTDENGVVQTK